MTTRRAVQRSGRPLMDWEQAAQYLSTSVRHLRYLRETGRVPAVKVGGLIRFDPDRVDAWLAEHADEPYQPPRRR